MKIIIALAALNLYFAHADKFGDAAGGPANKGAKAEVAAAEAGEPLQEEAQAGGGHSKLRKGLSWKHTQAILMGSGAIKCRLGGASARVAAVPALLSAGFCQVTGDKAKNFKKLPVGTVWVYSHFPHGNTLVKVSQDSYFDNRSYSRPHIPRGQEKMTVLVPGCGKKANKCGDFAVEKVNDASQTTAENAEMIPNSVLPSAEDLKKEEACGGYPAAYRTPEEFVACLNPEP